MTTPALFYSFLISSLFGTGFHFWKGGGAGRLFLYLLLSWMGFAGGHLLAANAGVSFFTIGPIFAGMGSLGSIFMILIGHWTSRQLEEV